MTPDDSTILEKNNFELSSLGGSFHNSGDLAVMSG